MKQLIRRLARVAHSSNYSLLRSDSHTPRVNSRRPIRRHKLRRSTVPQGHVPVYVGDELERFIVSAELLNHPVFVGLLDKSAQEYGYEQNGGLRIPCHVIVFERVLEAVKLGHYESAEFKEIVNSLQNAEFL